MCFLAYVFLWFFGLCVSSFFRVIFLVLGLFFWCPVVFFSIWVCFVVCWVPVSARVVRVAVFLSALWAFFVFFFVACFFLRLLRPLSALLLVRLSFALGLFV